MQTKTVENSSDWKKATSPNYKVHKNFEYPYSECPFLGDYNLIRIPEEGLVEHVDYWGEGYIEVSKGISGFKDSYNVNHMYRIVSDGEADIKGRKIPNRIPVVNYADCRTGGYIKDNAVRIVTSTYSWLNKSCISDISRMINDAAGLVILYGIDRNSQDVKNLEEQINLKKIVYCPSFEIPTKLYGLTAFNRHLSFVNIKDFNETLYNHVTSGQYDEAVTLCIELSKARQGNAVVDVVDRLLNGSNPKTMTFAYKLWFGGAQDIVTDWFPAEFQHILRSDNVKIINNYYDQALKLDTNVDEDKDRLAWGDNSDKTSKKVQWKFIPLSEGSHVVFKVQNVEYSMFLKLDVHTDSDGDRKCYGSESSGEKRHKWLLEVLRHKGDVLFFIINDEYQQGLKLAADKHSSGDRVLWGHNGNVIENPNYFGWKIMPM